jgi:hypothetical protein
MAYVPFRIPRAIKIRRAIRVGLASVFLIRRRFWPPERSAAAYARAF